MSVSTMVSAMTGNVRPLRTQRNGETFQTQSAAGAPAADWTSAKILSVRHHVGIDAPARIDRFGNTFVVIAGDDDRIAARIDATHHANVPARASPGGRTAARHDRDGADLR